jgi:hypothetical protein
MPIIALPQETNSKARPKPAASMASDLGRYAWPGYMSQRPCESCPLDLPPSAIAAPVEALHLKLLEIMVATDCGSSENGFVNLGCRERIGCRRRSPLDPATLTTHARCRTTLFIYHPSGLL